MLTVEGFRLAAPALPETLVPDARVEFYLRLAAKRLDKERWDDLYEEGAYFFAAHYLTLELDSAKAKDGTGAISTAAGAVVSSSKSVGGVSKSESRAGAAATANPAAGQWNLTWYGQQYWHWSQLVGAGGTVV